MTNWSELPTSKWLYDSLVPLNWNEPKKERKRRPEEGLICDKDDRHGTGTHRTKGDSIESKQRHAYKKSCSRGDNG